MGNRKRADLFLLNNMPSDEEKPSWPSAAFIDCREVQPAKALLQILVTDSGMLTVCSEVQSWKVTCFISVTELGISMDCMEVQPAKASCSISVTDSGME